MKRGLMLDQVSSTDEGPLLSAPPGWELTTCRTPDEAMAAIGARPFDAVVSAAPVPSVEALKILIQAKEAHPATVRLLVTADIGNRATVNVTSVAHEHLSAPVSPDSFDQAYSRAASMYQHLSSVRVRSAMAKVKSLPAFPRIYNQIVDELESGDGNLDRIARIVLQDPGLTARVLQLVNSPFYGLRRQVSETAKAVGLLGIQNLLSMVLAMEVFSEFTSSTARLNLNRLWTHAATVALWAKKIAQAEGRTTEEANEAFVAGMLHDCGRMVLAHSFPEHHASFVRQLEHAEVPFIELEHSTMGANHAEVGAYLLDSWQLPTPIVEAVAFHHNPSDSCLSRYAPLTAVHAAEVFHDAFGADGVERRLSLDMAYLERIGLAHRVEAWREACDLEDA